jgi:hypothetical protein
LWDILKKNNYKNNEGKQKSYFTHIIGTKTFEIIGSEGK